MKPRGRRLLAGLGVIAVVIATPFALRAMPFFRVRRVEVVGARYLAPERIAEALALAPGQNLFDPLGDAEAHVGRLAGVEQATVSRRVPGTVRVSVVEREPVGLVPGAKGLQPVDCDGAALPYDPTRSGLALPIVERRDSVLVRALCVVRAGDSTLYDAVQMVRDGGGGSVVLELAEQRVRLNGTPSTSDIVAIAVVRRHLDETGRSFRELDARYRGLVYARGRRS